MNEKQVFIQAYMDENICFGCGQNHPEGLNIHSIWQGDTMICEWNPTEKYQGWKGLMNGGILATLMDCHTMATATAHAYKIENNRTWDSLPTYRYATGTLNIKYLKPTPIDKKIILKAFVKEVKGKKTIIFCEIWAGEEKTAEGEVIAIRVFDSSLDNENNVFRG
ncbi:MAG: PaaI family thioesterase [Cytophagia bacterium]|nr:MAG: PaaI family thioesterase [Cytophagia bacterium]TAG40460.1 MAG: PaaI family thioesterase [Cytophagia bacterium]TAH29740.1 MAG: PaaI family thioesterase [Cytophagales bacterium]